MSETRKMMWVPMVVSAAALAAGLAGIVLAGDWKLLLVLPVGMGLTHGFSELHFRNVAKLEKKLAEHQKAVGRIDAAFSALSKNNFYTFPTYQPFGRHTKTR